MSTKSWFCKCQFDQSVWLFKNLSLSNPPSLPPPLQHTDWIHTYYNYNTDTIRFSFFLSFENATFVKQAIRRPTWHFTSSKKTCGNSCGSSWRLASSKTCHPREEESNNPASHVTINTIPDVICSWGTYLPSLMARRHFPPELQENQAQGEDIHLSVIVFVFLWMKTVMTKAAEAAWTEL